MAVPKGPISEDVQVVWLGALVKSAVEQGTRAALRELGQDMVTTAQDLVHVDTGLLQSSIVAEEPVRTGSTFEMAFGVFDVPYAYWQEVIPEPTGKAYIRPAVDGNIDKLEALLEEYIAGAFDDFEFNTLRRGFSQ